MSVDFCSPMRSADTYSILLLVPAWPDRQLPYQSLNLTYSRPGVRTHGSYRRLSGPHISYFVFSFSGRSSFRSQPQQPHYRPGDLFTYCSLLPVFCNAREFAGVDITLLRELSLGLLYIISLSRYISFLRRIIRDGLIQQKIKNVLGAMYSSGSRVTRADKSVTAYAQRASAVALVQYQPS